jgi:hypothetical protein
MGGMNYHIEVRFDDGVTWLARVRRFNATSPPPALKDYIIRSEVATLMFLEKTDVPAPKVYDYALEGPNNPVRVGFMLVEKMPGKSLRVNTSLTVSAPLIPPAVLMWARLLESHSPLSCSRRCTQ